MSENNKPWANPNHPGNRIRPRIKCIGCGIKGCITYWGPWCLKCNIERMDYLTAQFNKIAENM